MKMQINRCFSSQQTTFNSLKEELINNINLKVDESNDRKLIITI